MEHRRGLTSVGVLTTLALLGAGLSVAFAGTGASPEQLMRHAADRLAFDLSLARLRARATDRRVRVAFSRSIARYEAFLDHDADGQLAESRMERDAFRSFPRRTLPDGVVFGRGAAPALPTDTGHSAIGFGDDRVDFGRPGERTNAGGTVYLRHREDPSLVVAVSVSPSAHVTAHLFIGGRWRR